MPESAIGSGSHGLATIADGLSKTGALKGLLDSFSAAIAGDSAAQLKILNGLAQTINAFADVAPGPAGGLVGIASGIVGLKTADYVYHVDLADPNSTVYTIEGDMITMVGDGVSVIGNFLKLAGYAPTAELVSLGGGILGGVGIVYSVLDHSNIENYKAIENKAIFYALDHLSTLDQAVAFATKAPATLSDWKSLHSSLELALTLTYFANTDTDNTKFETDAKSAASAWDLAISDAEQLASDLVTNPALTSTSASDRALASNTFVTAFENSGYYLAQAGDTAQSIVSLLTNSNSGPGVLTVDAFKRLNAALNGGTLTEGTMLRVPSTYGVGIVLGAGASTTLSKLPSGECYVLDPLAGVLFTVGANLDGSDSGALIIDTPNASGKYTVFDQGTVSAVGVESDGEVDIALTTVFGDPLATLTFNPASGAGKATLPSGAVQQIHLTSSGPVSDPPSSPEQILINYLSQLGDTFTAAQLDQDNYAYLNPAANSYVVTSSSVSPNSNNTAATVYYNVNTPGAIVAGQSSVQITFTDNTGKQVQANVPATNVLNVVTEDLSQDQISNIQQLHLSGNAALTANQFNSFTKITGAGDLVLTTAGTLNLSSSEIDPSASIYQISATDLGGSTLIGDNQPGQILTASTLGNDMLVAGNGAGDTLEAGGGIDTLKGGVGGDFFLLQGDLGAGSQLLGSGSNNTLESNTSQYIDLTGVTISDIQTLSARVKLTIAQLTEFSTINAPFQIIDTASNIENNMALLIKNANLLNSIDSTDAPVILNISQFSVARSIDFNFTIDPSSKSAPGVLIEDTASNIENYVNNLNNNIDYIYTSGIFTTDFAPAFSAQTVAQQVNWGVLNKIKSGFAINDTAANIESGLFNLMVYDENNGDTLDSITATDGPVVVSVVDLLTYQPLLDMLTGGFTVSDSAADVSSLLPELQTFASNKQLNGIQLTDGGTPILYLTGAERVQDAAALAAIKSPYSVYVYGEPAAPSDFNTTGVSDILIENTAGAVVTGDVVNGQETFATISGLGPEWTFHGNGGFFDDGSADFLIESTNGAIAVGEVQNGKAAYTQVGVLGAEWKFHGTGDFLGYGFDQFLMENTGGAVVLGAVEGGVAIYKQVAVLGPEWNFEGAGDYVGDGATDFLIENTNGAVVVGEVNASTGATNFTQVGALGKEWKFVASGDFLGDGQSQFLIESTNGAVVVGEVRNGQASYTQVGGLGPEWKFVGAGDYYGTGFTNFLIESTTGALVTGAITHGTVHFAQVSGLGAEWSFRG